MSRHVAGLVDFCVGFAEGGDRAVSAALARTKCNEKDLIFPFVDNLCQFFFELNFFLARQITFKDRILQMRSVIPTGPKNFTKAFRIADIISNNKAGAAHGGAFSEG